MIVAEKREGIEKINYVGKMVGNDVVKGRGSRIEGREE